MLRFVAWPCLKDDELSGSQMCVVTGPRIDLAIALIDRIKKLFASSKGLIVFNTKETVVELNNVKIEVVCTYIHKNRLPSENRCPQCNPKNKG